MEVVSVNAAKKIDKDTIDKIGVPGIILMENAAEQIYSNILHKGEKFFVCCGVGNNGGDGLALARKLIINNKQVDVMLCGNIDKMSQECKINYDILCNLTKNIIFAKEEDSYEQVIEKIKNADIVIDSLFGIGLNRRIEGIYYIVIDIINSYSKYIVSVDIPSGLNADNGEVHGICVKANETYTVQFYKKGFFIGSACEYLGDINVINIGFPKKVISTNSEDIKVLDREDYRHMLPKRNKTFHKGDLGRVLILSGSSGFTGAAYITTEAAVRTGAGLVTLLVPSEVQKEISSRFIEAMTVNYNEEERVNKLIDQADVIACGPGLGTMDEAVDMLKKVIKRSKCPIVIDADAINIISKERELLNFVARRGVITPHLGEMSRIVHKSILEIEQSKLDICKSFSKENEIVTLLKGYNTVISNGHKLIINTTGSSKMASGGMGDCLTGIISSLIAQGMEIMDAAVLGCYVHGLSADVLGKNRFNVNARDVIEQIPIMLENIKIL